VPQRTCVGCRQTLAKRGMVRIVRTPEGLRVDPTGKVPGRGAYLHDRRSCWEQGLKGALAHALKVELSISELEMLRSRMQALPEDAPERPGVADQEPAMTQAQQPGDERRTIGSLGNST